MKIPARHFIVLIALLFCAAASAQTSTASGRLWAVGNNSTGELGDGTTTSHTCPVPVVSDGVQAMAAGADFSLILKADGSLWAMGDNSYGELGDGTTTQRDSPEQILSGGVESIAAGDDFSLFVKTDGSLWAMGDNSYGQLGDGTTTQRHSPVQILSGGIQAIAAGAYHSLILKTDGSLWAMGVNWYGQLGDGTTIQRNSPVEMLSGGVQAVAAGAYHNLILKTDGSLWTVGQNMYGQLGDGTETQRNVPVQILAGGVQAVSAGFEHSLILKTDGSLWAMGYNGYGQLGDGTTEWGCTSPVQILSGGVRAIAGGTSHSLILTTDGCLWAMGANDSGQLGDGTLSGQVWPELVAVNVLKIAAGGSYSLLVGSGNIADAPAFSAQPASRTMVDGNSISFAVTAAGVPLPTYQWQVSTDGGSDWANLSNGGLYSGATMNTLTITGATTAMSGYRYRCLASNWVASNVASDAAALTVVLSDQAFLQQLFLDVLGRRIDSGAAAAFGVALAGGESRVDVLGDLLASAEYGQRQIEPVIRLYYAAFARMPDYAGLQNWSNSLQAETYTLTGAADYFATSPEFLQTYGRLTDTQYVNLLYANVLGRAPDQTGLQTWLSVLAGGASRGAVLVGFSESAEFQANMVDQVEIIRLYAMLLKRAPTAAELQDWIDFLDGDYQTETLYAQGYPAGLSNAEYVKAVFSGFLRRDADTGALSSFGSALDAGTLTHGGLVNALLCSAEFSQYVGPVSRLYLSAFRRVPDQPGLDNWVNYMRAGNPLESVADAFVASPEFQLTYGSLDETQYVTLLYENVLGREPDPSGLVTWTGNLSSGWTRGQVLIGFSESREAMQLLAPTLRTFLHYFAFLNMAPAQSDLDYWKNYLATLDAQIRDDLLVGPAFNSGG